MWCVEPLNDDRLSVLGKDKPALQSALLLAVVGLILADETADSPDVQQAVEMEF